MIADLESDTAAADVEDDTDDKEGLLVTAKAWFREDREHSVDWRIEATEDYDFAALRQWSDDDKAVLKEQMRPEITFDKTAVTIKTIVGLEIGNRREVRYIPRTEGDAKPDEILTAAADWARGGCDAEDEETDAFKDTVICGMGWVDTRLDYEDDPEGKIKYDRIDPIEMYWDGSARKPNLSDARRTWRVKTLPIEDARLLAPDAEDEDLDAAWAVGDLKKEPHNADPQVAYQQDIGEELDKKQPKDVTLVHLQYWERETYYRVAFGGQVESVSEADFPKLKARIEQFAPGQPLKSVKQVRKVYKQALIGAKVLSMGPTACEGHFSWECITGERDQNKGTWYGIVRAMKDPQRWANKWLSQSLHILNSNAKGGIYAERDAFDNDRDAEDSIAKSERITYLKPGGLAKIQPKEPPALPQNLAQLMTYALSSIRDASGVNLELSGLQEQDQSGVLAEHRKQSGMTVLAGLFDSLRRYRKRQGRILLYFIQNYISDGRLIRIVGEEGAKYVPLVHQPGLVEYDVIVDDDPTSTNQKEKVWATLMQMMPFIGDKLDAGDMATLFEYSPLPTTVVEKWQKKIEDQQEQQAPIEQRMHELEMMVAETKAMLQKAQADKASADAQATMAEIGQGPEGDGGAGIAKAQADFTHKMHATEAKTATDRMKIEADLQAKREKMIADRASDREWQATDQAVQAHRDVMSAAGKVQAAKITAASRPKTSVGAKS